MGQSMTSGSGNPQYTSQMQQLNHSYGQTVQANARQQAGQQFAGIPPGLQGFMQGPQPLQPNPQPPPVMPGQQPMAPPPQAQQMPQPPQANQQQAAQQAMLQAQMSQQAQQQSQRALPQV